MSMITEKRNEVANKLNSLLAERKATIDFKVNAYRTQLEAEPISEEIINTKKLLVALDEVISCEAAMAKPVINPIVTETIVAATPEVTVNVSEADIKVAEEVKPEVVQPEVMDFVEITVDPETKETEVTTPIAEARPGMAYVGIPERR